MLDQHQREINYLRLSVTGRCNLDCIYCKRESGKSPDFTVEEIGRLARALTALGVKKIRLTGGEPLMRKDIVEIVRVCAEAPGLADLAMTTNAILMPRYATGLKESGLSLVNISLNTTEPETFKQMCRYGRLDEVLVGMKEAEEAGFPVKINVVLMRGVNDAEIGDFIRMAKERPIEVRFIEYMPMGRKYDKSKMIPTEEVLERFPELLPLENENRSSVARLYRGEGYKGLVGFISPVSHAFCHLCNRLRITHDAKLRMCLGDDGETDLRTALAGSDEELAAFLEEAIAAKPKQGFCSDFTTKRGMGNIGG
ncbi:MAG: GTP 3',8-cyclase MoaA [Clostridiales bacterium]|nr:GTP 3',8-cyclase MoaA [Clostridiales bacterium]